MIEHGQHGVCSAEDEAVRVALRHQRGNLQRVLDRHEQERREIAARLIDLAVDAVAATEPELARGTVTELVHQLGALAGELRPSLLDDIGLAAALERLVDDIAARTLRPLAVTVDPRIGELPPRVALALYRIVEDLLAASAGPLRARLRRVASGWIELVVVAGVGGVSGHVVAPEHLALARARVELLGGLLSTTTPRAGGLLLHTELPI
jgi:signal transduction histidine kinase